MQGKSPATCVGLSLCRESLLQPAWDFPCVGQVSCNRAWDLPCTGQVFCNRAWDLPYTGQVSCNRAWDFPCVGKVSCNLRGTFPLLVRGWASRRLSWQVEPVGSIGTQIARITQMSAISYITVCVIRVICVLMKYPPLSDNRPSTSADRWHFRGCKTMNQCSPVVVWRIYSSGYETPAFPVT